MSLELWLVRHGETPASRDGVLAGWRDVPLTETGVAQAEAVRPRARRRAFDGAWSSDLQRAVHTAHLAWGDAVADPRLREISFGELEGRAWATLDPVYKRALAEFDGFHPAAARPSTTSASASTAFSAELPPAATCSSPTAG